MTIIRSIGRDQAEKFKTLRLKSLEESPDAFDSSAKSEGPLSLKDWKNWVGETPERRVFVAEENGAYVGTITVAPYPFKSTMMTLFALWVAPEQRRKKVGTELVQKALEFAATTSRESVRVHVGERNAAAIAFFESLGFQDTGERLSFRADLDFDAWILERSLR